MIYLDTHVVAWLYASTLDRIPSRARDRLRADELRISPIVLLELEYLHEIGRTAAEGTVVVEYLKGQLGLVVCRLPFDEVIGAALDQTWTRDPFDRLIVGQAAVHGSALLTKDTTLHEHYPHSIWD